MQKMFVDTRDLDEACRNRFCLSEDLMMENAASALEKSLSGKEDIMIMCGGGNNGGDGYALARKMISRVVSVVVVACMPEKSDMCCLQKKRAEKCGITIVPLSDAQALIDENNFDAIVDCIFGIGFHGKVPKEIASLLKKVNSLDTYRLSCDIPSGLDKFGNISGECFHADETVTMGALKVALFSDYAKDVCGKIVCADLGFDREIYENSLKDRKAAKYYLLDESDCKYPERKKKNVHKGNFGHAVFIGGEKIGAAVLASCAALKFGAGLVTLVDFKNQRTSGEKILLDENGLPGESIIPYEIMCGKDFPEKTTAVAIGMGLGQKGSIRKFEKFNVEYIGIPVVFDADIFYRDNIWEILMLRSKAMAPTVLTPHPKEFAALLSNCFLGTFPVEKVVKNRIELAKKFTDAYPGVVLLLKGSNVLIAKSGLYSELYFNPCGTPSLAKAGSGDVLTGLVTALLAQGYSPVDAAISASLAHALSSQKISPDFSLTPFELIKKI